MEQKVQSFDEGMPLEERLLRVRDSNSALASSPQVSSVSGEKRALHANRLKIVVRARPACLPIPPRLVPCQRQRRGQLPLADGMARPHAGVAPGLARAGSRL